MAFQSSHLKSAASVIASYVKFFCRKAFGLLQVFKPSVFAKGSSGQPGRVEIWRCRARDLDF